MHLAEFTPEQRPRLEAAADELVVKVNHRDLAESWDVWWWKDYERFAAQYPDAEQDFAVRPTFLEEAGAFINLLDPTAPTFALFSKGRILDRYERNTLLISVIMVITPDNRVYMLSLLAILHQGWRGHHICLYNRGFQR